MRDLRHPAVSRDHLVRAARMGVLTACLLPLTGCTYLRLLRPAVLKQLTPATAELVDYLPRLDSPNDAVVGRLFAQGGLSHARLGPDGVMRDRVRVRVGKVVWEPSILVLPRGGTLEVEVTNEDENTHIAYFPSRGANQVLVLPPHSAGRLRISLSDPGLYTFADGVSNTSGRGMLGVIIVEGETPGTARLERPRQPRPES